MPIAAAAASPQLEWRGPVYILAGFAGIIGLGLLLVQPLLIGGYLPGPSSYRGRRAHHWIGGVLVALVVVHVGGLWITSPPDMIDALLLTSPTPFSPFGVIAMWAIFAVALLAAFRRRLGLRRWRIAHMVLAAIIVIGSVAHGLLIEGTIVKIDMYNGNPIGFELPAQVELVVSYTEPGVRGDTASGSVTKPAKLETGAEVRVPFYIKEGEKIKLSTETREFAGRA